MLTRASASARINGNKQKGHVCGYAPRLFNGCAVIGLKPKRASIKLRSEEVELFAHLFHSWPDPVGTVLGPSKATLAPALTTTCATLTNASHISLIVAKCLRNLASPPGRLRLIFCHGQPPMQGIDPHSMVQGPSIASKAMDNPFGVATSSSSASRTTVRFGCFRGLSEERVGTTAKFDRSPWRFGRVRIGSRSCVLASHRMIIIRTALSRVRPRQWIDPRGPIAALAQRVL